MIRYRIRFDLHLNPKFPFQIQPKTRFPQASKNSNPTSPNFRLQKSSPANFTRRLRNLNRNPTELENYKDKAETALKPTPAQTPDPCPYLKVKI